MRTCRFMSKDGAVCKLRTPRGPRTRPATSLGRKRPRSRGRPARLEASDPEDVEIVLGLDGVAREELVIEDPEISPELFVHVGVADVDAARVGRQRRLVHAFV